MIQALEADYLLFTDESGNDGESLQVLAGIAGRPRDLAELEDALRAILRRHGVRELKWAGVRTRKERHLAARDFLRLACEAAAKGQIWVDLMALRGPSLRSPGPEGKAGRERWMLLYRGLLWRSRLRGRGGSWTLLPDQRTGMPWKRLGRLTGLRAVLEISSSDMALIQLADLLAGLTRFSLERREGAAERARIKRQQLLDDFSGMLKAGKLGSLKATGRRAGGPFKLWLLKNLKGAKREQEKKRRD